MAASFRAIGREVQKVLRHYCACVLLIWLAAFAAPAQENTAAGLFAQGMNAIRGSMQNRNDARALDLFRKSADMGYAPAQVVLGYFYDTGTLVTSEPERALTWYKKAAERGDPLAAWLVGRLMFLGVVPPHDGNEAAPWLQQSAGAGNPFAAYVLGLFKVQKSEYANAAGWFRKATEQGLPQAQSELGRLLLDGPIGVKRDKFEAYVWLLMVKDSGYAQPDLQTLEVDLGSARTEEAKTLARQREAKFARAIVAHGCTGFTGEFDRIPVPPPPDIQQFCR